MVKNPIFDNRLGVIAAAGISVLAGLGCAQPKKISSADAQRLTHRAMECLKLGVRYEYLPSVRAQALEALVGANSDQALPWIRLALHDEHPGVRFAACMALGERRDPVADPEVRKLWQRGVPTDRIGAIYYLHRRGDISQSAQLAEYLIENNDPVVRSNAALVLGRLGEPGAIKLLARVMKEDDIGLRANALESMALLGAEEALSTLTAQAYSGIGAEETFAVRALAEVRSDQFKALMANKLVEGQHLETRLAAARGLGMLGDGEGFVTAKRALKHRSTKDAKNDPADNQTLRIRQLALLALGAIGNPDCLGDIEDAMNEAADPRLQIAAAKSVLDILGDTGRRPRAVTRRTARRGSDRR